MRGKLLMFGLVALIFAGVTAATVAGQMTYGSQGHGDGHAPVPQGNMMASALQSMTKNMANAMKGMAHGRH